MWQVITSKGAWISHQRKFWISSNTCHVDRILCMHASCLASAIPVGKSILSLVDQCWWPPQHNLCLFACIQSMFHHTASSDTSYAFNRCTVCMIHYVKILACTRLRQLEVGEQYGNSYPWNYLKSCFLIKIYHMSGLFHWCTLFKFLKEKSTTWQVGKIIMTASRPCLSDFVERPLLTFSRLISVYVMEDHPPD